MFKWIAERIKQTSKQLFFGFNRRNDVLGVEIFEVIFISADDLVPLKDVYVSLVLWQNFSVF